MSLSLALHTLERAPPEARPEDSADSPTASPARRGIDSFASSVPRRASDSFATSPKALSPTEAHAALDAALAALQASEHAHSSIRAKAYATLCECARRMEMRRIDQERISRLLDHVVQDVLRGCCHAQACPFAHLRRAPTAPALPNSLNYDQRYATAAGDTPSPSTPAACAYALKAVAFFLGTLPPARIRTITDVLVHVMMATANRACVQHACIAIVHVPHLGFDDAQWKKLLEATTAALSRFNAYSSACVDTLYVLHYMMERRQDILYHGGAQSVYGAPKWMKLALDGLLSVFKAPEHANQPAKEVMQAGMNIYGISVLGKLTELLMRAPRTRATAQEAYHWLSHRDGAGECANLALLRESMQRGGLRVGVCMTQLSGALFSLIGVYGTIYGTLVNSFEDLFRPRNEWRRTRGDGTTAGPRVAPVEELQRATHHAKFCTKLLSVLTVWFLETEHLEFRCSLYQDCWRYLFSVPAHTVATGSVQPIDASRERKRRAKRDGLFKLMMTPFFNTFGESSKVRNAPMRRSLYRWRGGLVGAEPRRTSDLVRAHAARTWTTLALEHADHLLFEDAFQRVCGGAAEPSAPIRALFHAGTKVDPNMFAVDGLMPALLSDPSEEVQRAAVAILLYFLDHDESWADAFHLVASLNGHGPTLVRRRFGHVLTVGSQLRPTMPRPNAWYWKHFEFFALCVCIVGYHHDGPQRKPGKASSVARVWSAFVNRYAWDMVIHDAIPMNQANAQYLMPLLEEQKRWIAGHVTHAASVSILECDGKPNTRERLMCLVAVFEDLVVSMLQGQAVEEEASGAVVLGRSLVRVAEHMLELLPDSRPWRCAVLCRLSTVWGALWSKVLDQPARPPVRRQRLTTCALGWHTLVATAVADGEATVTQLISLLRASRRDAASSLIPWIRLMVVGLAPATKSHGSIGTRLVEQLVLFPFTDKDGEVTPVPQEVVRAQTVAARALGSTALLDVMGEDHETQASQYATALLGPLHLPEVYRRALAEYVARHRPEPMEQPAKVSRRASGPATSSDDVDLLSLGSLMPHSGHEAALEPPAPATPARDGGQRAAVPVQPSWLHPHPKPMNALATAVAAGSAMQKPRVPVPVHPVARARERLLAASSQRNKRKREPGLVTYTDLDGPVTQMSAAETQMPSPQKKAKVSRSDPPLPLRPDSASAPSLSSSLMNIREWFATLEHLKASLGEASSSWTSGDLIRILRVTGDISSLAARQLDTLGKE